MIGLELGPTLVWSLAALVVALVTVPYALFFHRHRRTDRERLREARALGIDRPSAQFPFIDPVACIGCGACVRACPERDVLGVVGGVAVIINGVRCVGHGRCADACPVGAIEIGLGDLKGRRDVPLLTPEFETVVPGVFVAGELSGLALIRNAVEQGETALRTIAGRVRAAPARPRDAEVLDLAIVGAGPAGISAALAAQQAGLRYVVLEQAASFGGTILHFPRRKMVLTRPVELPGGGTLAREEYSKEELLELLHGEIQSRRLPVSFGARLESLRRLPSHLEVVTSAGTHAALNVLLALGRRGTPRRLDVPGEERPKVMYQLRDAETYRGQRILVVGGGDSAVEAAVGLARQPGNEVVLSYRKSGLFRIKQKNQKSIEGLVARGRIRAVFDSEVESIEEDRVTLRVGTRSESLANDWVFVLIGGDPPYRLLESCGVRFGGDHGGESPPAPGGRAGRIAGLVAGLALLGGLPLAAQASPHGESVTRCEDCHATADWKVVREGVKFRHDDTGFPLTGVHAALHCAQCHTNPVFTRVATACADCHRDAHGGELGLACADCHDTQRWDVKSDFYSAHAKTLFPLVAGHARVDCEACHTAAPPRQFSNVPTDCVACHRADYLAAGTPAHGGVPTDCRQCHTGGSESWLRTSFRHPERFALTGAHAGLACEECHRGPASTTSPDCYDCHRGDYEATRDPNHVRAAFPTSCAACHRTTSWSSGVFDHFTTGFALDGAHRNAACGACHAGGYAGTPRDCYSCHRADYAGTRDPAHDSAGFSTSCQSCHTTTTWGGAVFDHARSAFPLTGAHRGTDCAQCHASGYAGTPRDCVSCHRADYDRTADPNHTTAGFPTTCQACHTTTAWTGAPFDHATTAFPLTGAHRTTDCAQCHTAGYAGTPKDCHSCHAADYAATSDPNHAAAGFPTTCENCHTTTGWTGAAFNHSNTGFALTGAHVTTACAQCHTSGYAGTPSDCYSCHEADYQGTNDPNHGSAGFSTACQTCHTTSGWEGADFDHDASFFPIYSGSHQGRWSSCSDCHTTSNFQQFSCLGCHGQTATNNDHNEVSGYSYSSSACYSCHPDGTH